jgi:predicted SAM-dependent methyltransferase
MEWLGVHVGCGSKYIPGLVHVDVIAASHVDVVATVDKMPYFDSGSVDFLYASHVLEHFGRHEYEAVLAEWFRVLKPGGVLRLSVPNFAACVSWYAETGQLSGPNGILGLICGGQKNEYDFHKMVFDERLLRHALYAVGFTKCRAWDWRTTTHATIDDYSQAYLPHLEKEGGLSMSLNLEAVK